MARDENTQVEDKNEPNWLEMSDEELLKAPVPDFSAAADEKKSAADATQAEEEATEEEVDPKDDKAPAAEGKPGAEESEEDPDEEKDPKEGDEAKDPKDPKGEKPPVKEAKETKKEEAKDDKPAEGEIDFAAAGKELLAPFKANGREIQVRSVEDARALMQMGANYNKKMAALKPNLKLMKMLENNDLLSEDKLSFLIDLSKKDQGAINKLVKDSGLNPMDLDAEKAGEYKPKTHSVDDREVELDNVLSELEGSPAYARTLDIVGKQWDGPSKQAIAQHPGLLQVLHDHIDRGIYDLIAAEVEQQRTFGRLKGMSDLEAYRQVGDQIQARGGFNHLGSSQGKTSPDAKVVVQPKPKSGADDKRDEKRRALSSPKPAATSPKTNADFNPLSMSDEEFEKQAAKRFR